MYAQTVFIRVSNIRNLQNWTEPVFEVVYMKLIQEKDDSFYFIIYGFIFPSDLSKDREEGAAFCDSCYVNTSV